MMFQEHLITFEMIRRVAMPLILAQGTYLEKGPPGVPLLTLSVELHGERIRWLKLRDGTSQMPMGVLAVLHHGIEEAFFCALFHEQQILLSLRHRQNDEQFLLLSQGMHWIYANLCLWHSHEMLLWETLSLR